MSTQNNSFAATTEDKKVAKKSNLQQQYDANNSHSGSICLSNNLFDSSFTSQMAQETADSINAGFTFGPQQQT